MSENFFDQEFLKSNYVKEYRTAYQKLKNTVFLNPYRNYHVLLCSLKSIHGYNSSHANSFIKRIKAQQNNFRNCEAVFTEILVYVYYLRLVPEGIVKSLDIRKDDYDLKVELADGSRYYLEIFCIMPDLLLSQKGEIKVKDMQTHMQVPYSSIRQKLHHKISERRQLTKPRNNFAVIELNDARIAGDFHVLSSLPAGYNINIDPETNKRISEGFDWSSSIFDNETARHIKGIIYFSLGDYDHRKYIPNPFFNPSRAD